MAERVQKKKIHAHVHFQDEDDPPPSLVSYIPREDEHSKSFRRVNTIEKVPNTKFYSQSSAKRPTLAELQERNRDESAFTLDERFEPDYRTRPTTPPAKPTGAQLGWVEGVFLRCVASILGVMLFIRISWVVGQAGLGWGTGIVLLSSLVTALTTISMSAIATNGEIRGGGVYYLLSRSLGPGFGGSIGLMYSIANAVAAAMYLVGVAETLQDLLRDCGVSLVDDGINDIRLLSFALALVLFPVAMCGARVESRMQMLLLAVLMAALLNFFVGTFLPSTELQKARGVTGYSIETLQENWSPSWGGWVEVFSVLSVYFPATTGIFAGASISGDLRRPSTSIPRGTLGAIFLTTLIYLWVLWTTGMACLRDASGQLLNQTNLLPCGSNGTECKYGLNNHFQIVELMSGWSPLVTAGIFAASLSSALANLISAPKVFQAVSRDQLFPYTHKFARGYGKSDEPLLAYLLAFFICSLVILIGRVNSIAPLISNFFLASYALLNYACFDASSSGSPGFRPGFKLYNRWVSLGTAVLCVGMMFLINWWTALLTFVFAAVLFLYLHYKRKPGVNWGSSGQANAFRGALLSMLKLSSVLDHVKTYRPQVLVLTGNPLHRPALLDFAASITKEVNGLLIFGDVVLEEPKEGTFGARRQANHRVQVWLQHRKLRGFYQRLTASELRGGVRTLLQVAGLGKLLPNIVLMGFKQNWRRAKLQEVQNYVGIIHDVFDNEMALGILRVPDGLDLEEAAAFDRGPRTSSQRSTTQSRLPNPLDISLISSASGGPMPFDLSSASFNPNETVSNFNNASELGLIREEESSESSETETKRGVMSMDRLKGRPKVFFRARDSAQEREDSVVSFLTVADATKANIFRTPVKRGRIDVWWLYEDGGLTLLIPYLLTLPRSYLDDARLRVFVIASSRQSVEQERRQMALLLTRFRIDFADVIMITDLAKKPRPTTLMYFDTVTQRFRQKGLILDEELERMREKTFRQLRTRELLLERSASASLVVLTLPIPRRVSCTDWLYLCWLEALSADLPPVLLLRGNQQPVITFYS